MKNIHKTIVRVSSTVVLGATLIGQTDIASAASEMQQDASEQKKISVSTHMSLTNNYRKPQRQVKPEIVASRLPIQSPIIRHIETAPPGTNDQALVIKFRNHIPIRRSSTLQSIVNRNVPNQTELISAGLLLQEQGLMLSNGLEGVTEATSQRVTTRPVVPVINMTPVRTNNRVNSRLSKNATIPVYKLIFANEQQTSRDARKMEMAGPTVADIEQQLEQINQILNDGRVEKYEPLFERSLADLARERQVAEKAMGAEMSDLANYLRITFTSASEALEVLTELRDLELVEHAYFPPIPDDADLAPTTSDFEGSQGYLESAEESNGIDARYAWDFAGGRGELVKIIDIEVGWNLAHEDLPAMFYSHGFNFWDNDHGTAVLGQIAAIDDGSGVTGIANASQVGISSVINGLSVQFDPSLYIANVANAINLATGSLDAGDIILIEQHARGPGSEFGCTSNCSQWRYVAMEYWQAEFDAIQNATARGIVVVEAAGNGGQNLDHSRYENRFNRAVRDSGAIIVGGGTSDDRSPMPWTNFGTRLDVQGWGEKVMTLGYGNIQANGDDKDQWYTSSFSGTSSASPIVVGAAAILQGIRKTSGDTPFSPRDLRSLLVNTGNPQLGNNQIGPLPDLRSALDSLGMTPENQTIEEPAADGSCTQASSQSGECGGRACVNKPAGYVEGDCFLGIPFLCEDGYQLYHTDQFICADE